MESAARTNRFAHDPRLSVRRLRIGSTEVLSECAIDCWPGPTPPAQGRESKLSVADVFNAKYRTRIGTFLGPEQRLMVYRDSEIEDGDSESPQIEPLFVGTAPLIWYRERVSDQGHVDRGFDLPVRSIAEVVSELYGSQVVGRVMRSNESLLALREEDPEPAVFGDSTATRELNGFPAVFNPNGKANCAKVPITGTIGERNVVCSLFTHDRDDDALFWTWARVLRYLVYWYLFWDPGTPEDLIADGNLLDLTDTLQSKEHTEQPEAPVEAEDALEYALLGRPSGFSIEGMNVVEAMIAVCNECGVRFWLKPELIDTEEETELPVAQDKLYIWARGAGDLVDLHRTNCPAGTPADRTLAQNDIRDMEIGCDHREVVARPLIVGDVRRYEITAELVPGWEPEANLDNVATEGQAAALAYCEAHLDLASDPDELADDPWYQAYHSAGSDFYNHRDVGRRWVLNCSARYTAELFARTVGPFDADAYVPWEPSDCAITDTSIGEDGNVQTTPVASGVWTYRPRPFLPCFSASADKRSIGIVLELSFDGGSTWHRNCEGLTFRADAREDAVLIDTDDLTQLFAPGTGDPGSAADSFWDAMIRGLARVRVTAVVEGNTRLTGLIDPTNWRPTGNAESSRQWTFPQFKSNRRDGGNSRFAEAGAEPSPAATFEARDDLLDIQRKTLEIVSMCVTRQLPGAATIPWISQEYHPGQSLRSIAGLGLTFATTAEQQQTRYPDIVGCEIVDGYTTLAIEDWRVLERMMAREKREDAAAQAEQEGDAVDAANAGGKIGTAPREQEEA